MLVKIAIGSIALMLLTNHLSPASTSCSRWSGDTAALHGGADFPSDCVVRFAQDTPGAPDATQPDTNNPPGGVGRLETEHATKIAEAHDRPVRISGRITSVKGNKVEFATDSKDQKLKFILAPDATVTIVEPGSLADVKPGVGVGEGVGALYVFPAGTMSRSVVTANDGRTIKMGSYEIPVSPKTKVLRYTFGGKADIVRGANIYLDLMDGLAPNGSTEVYMVAVGKKGIKPIMILARPSGSEDKPDWGLKDAK